ncbi:MAG: gliding motility-associated C-terminal domain-containing protein [Chitinophagaceae bacterium]|nr:gliding motility-associated C-terminal domain-containing protein [Chitinophagaceae bacterium]
MKNFSAINLLIALFLTVLHQNSIAQCSGNVLFFENFGGSSSSPLTATRLPPGKTTYAFDSLGFVDDGEYGIRKTSADIATGQRQFGVWNIGTDHSGNGNMMVVNADFTAGKFYETTVNNLCIGSKLYFSAWVANLIPLGNNNPLDPILRFEISSAISGTVLSSFLTPAIPRFSAFTWTQYGFNFNLPPGESSVILRIFNNQVGGLGNDLCLDDIEFTLCGPAIAPALSGTYQNGSDACTGSNISIAGNVAPGFYTTPTYQWQFNDGMNGWVNIPGAITSNYSITNAQVANSGTYRLLVAENGNINSANCRSVSSLIPVNVYAPFVPILQTNEPICENDTLRISTISTALQYSWKNTVTTFPSTTNTLQIPSATLADAGAYSLDVVTNGGCTSTGFINVAVQANQLQRIIPFDDLLCDGMTLFIDADQPGAISYLWNDGITSSQRVVADAGVYSLLTSDGVCKRTDSFRITTNVTPVVNLGIDTTLCYNELLVLNAASPVADTYLWSTNVTDSAITVNTAGTYSVLVENRCGIAGDDIKVLYEDCANIIFVPNAFTPNNDRLNDVLKAKAYFKVDEFSMKIFNRWGQMIFSSNSLHTGWDGTVKGQQAPPGMYTWVIQYKRSNKVYNQKGTVLVIY